MIARNDVYISTLDSIRRAGGRVMPAWCSQTDRGVSYSTNDASLDERVLERLADGEYLDKIFVNRLSRCPSCRSHHLNFREICAACKSARITLVELLHHFRCGYVAPSYEFTPEADGRRCPKCHGVLRNRGTDHDSPGPHFICRSCDVSFQTPELGAFCLACLTHTHGAGLETIIYEDVFGYKITSLGESALVVGRLAVDGSEDRARPPKDGALMGRSMLVVFLEDERKRAKHSPTPFSVLLFGFEPPDGAEAPDETALIASISDALGETDILGRWDDNHYLALLRFTSEKQAQALARKLSSASETPQAAWKLRAHVVRLPEGEPALDRFLSALMPVALDG